MDDNIAAMVLTSLSCSPVSPHFPMSFTGKYMSFRCYTLVSVLIESVVKRTSVDFMTAQNDKTVLNILIF
jgi:hypothetical protein